eukprot:s1003_g15.t1
MDALLSLIDWINEGYDRDQHFEFLVFTFADSRFGFSPRKFAKGNSEVLCGGAPPLLRSFSQPAAASLVCGCVRVDFPLSSLDSVHFGFTLLARGMGCIGPFSPVTDLVLLGPLFLACSFVHPDLVLSAFGKASFDPFTFAPGFTHTALRLIRIHTFGARLWTFGCLGVGAGGGSTKAAGCDVLTQHHRAVFTLYYQRKAMTQLGVVPLVFDFGHLDFSLLLHDCCCLGLALFAAGMARLGPSLLALGVFHLDLSFPLQGSTLSLHSFSKLELSLSVSDATNLEWLGSSHQRRAFSTRTSPRWPRIARLLGCRRPCKVAFAWSFSCCFWGYFVRTPGDSGRVTLLGILGPWAKEREKTVLLFPETWVKF